MRRWPSLAALLILAALLAGALYAIAGLSNAIGWVRHTSDVRLALGRLQASCSDAETGLRGYLVAGDRRFLEPYERAARNWRTELDVLKKLTSDNPHQQRDLAEVELLVERQLQLLEQSRAAYDSGARGDELAVPMLGSTRALGEVRALIATMDELEDNLDDQRHGAAISRWKWTLTLLLAGMVAFIAAVAAFWVQRHQADQRRLRAEEAARSAELFKVVLEGAEVGITVQSPDGRLTYANAAAAQLTGTASPEAMLQEPAVAIAGRYEIYRADGSPMMFADLPGRALLKGQSAEPLNLRFVDRKTRAERWATVRSTPARSASGELLYVINFFRDITAEVREREQRGFLLKASMELQRTLDYQKTLATLARLAVPGLVDWCTIDLLENDVLVRVAQAHSDPVKLATVEELQRRYPADPNAELKAVLEQGQPLFIPEIPPSLLAERTVDAEHLKLVESLQLKTVIAAAIRARGKAIGVISVAMAESGRPLGERDIEVVQTFADQAGAAIDAARLLRDLERARDFEATGRRAAEAESQFAQTFIGILGHDLRNPINAVAMSAELLKRRANPGEGRVLDRILASTRRMATMVSQLLDLTRSRLGRGFELDRRPVDLVAVVSGVVDELRAIHPGRQIEWEPPAPAECVLDPGRVAQVFSNLIANALEHSAASSPVKVTLQVTDGWAHCAVHNDGAISPELLGSIFEPYRARRNPGARRKGLGLGVFISQQISLAHGGALEVSSTPETGTTFELNLPRGRSVAEPAGQPLE